MAVESQGQVKGERIELVANRDYWAEGPYVERITYKIIPDREEAFRALEAGEVHFRTSDAPCKEVEDWKAKPGVDVMFHPGNSIAFVAFNWTRALWQDHRVREAIARTIESVDPAGWKTRFQESADFDLILDSGDIGPDPQLMSSFLSSDGPRNSMRYANPTVDRAFEEGRGTTGRNKRGEHYRELQAALAEDIARVPFMQHGEHLPYRTEFTGWS